MTWKAVRDLGRNLHDLVEMVRWLSVVLHELATNVVRELWRSRGAESAWAGAGRHKKHAGNGAVYPRTATTRSWDRSHQGDAKIWTRRQSRSGLPPASLQWLAALGAPKSADRWCSLTRCHPVSRSVV